MLEVRYFAAITQAGVMGGTWLTPPDHSPASSTSLEVLFGAGQAQDTPQLEALLLLVPAPGLGADNYTVLLGALQVRKKNSTQRQEAHAYDTPAGSADQRAARCRARRARRSSCGPQWLA